MQNVFPANLAAVEKWNPAAAALLAAAAIPAGFQPATAADGSPTFRRSIDTPPRRIEWLGNTSVPRAGAASLTVDMNPGGGAAIGLSLGTGHEWLALLARLDPNQSLFILETDLPAARMALEVTDLSAHLAAGRLVLLLGDSPAEQLSAFLAAHTGFDVPQVLHVLPSLPPARRDALRSLGEAMIRRAVPERTHLGNALAAQLANYQPAAAPLVAFPATPAFAGQRLLASALRAAGRHAQVVSLPPDHHATTSLFARLEVLAKFRPAAVLSDYFRTQLAGGTSALPHALAIHTWVPPLAGHAYFSPERLPAAATLGPRDRVIVHSTDHRDLFAAHGVPLDRINVLPPALAADEIPAPTPAPLNLRHGGALIADVPPLDPAAYGFELPSHLAVWAAARRIIEEDPFSAFAHRSADILRRAQRAVNVALEAHLAGPMERAIRHGLLRAAVPLAAARQLSAAGVPLQLLGRGWNQLEIPHAAVAPFPAAHSETNPGPHAALENPARGNPAMENAARGNAPLETAAPKNPFATIAVACQIDPAGIVDPLLLHAAAAGAAIVAVEHPRDQEPAGIAAMFAAGEHFLRPRPRDFIAALRALLANEPQRQALAAAAASHIAKNHQWKNRRIETPAL